MTSREINKIIDLIRTKDVANIRLARLLTRDPIPILIKEAVLDIVGGQYDETTRRFEKRWTTDADMEALLFLKGELKELLLDLDMSFTSEEKIGQFKELEWLLLPSNDFITVPTSVLQLGKLKKLSLYENRLIELPKDIGDLKKLEVLDLEYNQLTALPDSICELKNLKALGLYGNQLTILPKQIGKLKNLKLFTLHKNPIEESEKKRLTSLFPNNVFYFD